MRVAARADRGSLAALALLAGLTAAAWLALLRSGGELEMQLGPFLGAWALMMTAMMLPSVAPLAILVARGAGSTLLLGLGYLSVWTAVGVIAFAAGRATDLMTVPPLAAAAVLVSAGVYQLTPLKNACLRRCRSPLSFVMRRWRTGWWTPVRLGVVHGGYCVACCWGLMAVLVGAAAMGVRWAALIAAAVFVEKALPGGEATARATGVALIAAAAIVVLT
jgi:predicted metal-binding membrane protein